MSARSCRGHTRTFIEIIDAEQLKNPLRGFSQFCGMTKRVSGETAGLASISPSSQSSQSCHLLRSTFCSHAVNVSPSGANADACLIGLLSD